MAQILHVKMYTKYEVWKKNQFKKVDKLLVI